MRVTILPKAIILTIENRLLYLGVLTKAHRTAVSIMAKGSIVA